MLRDLGAPTLAILAPAANSRVHSCQIRVHSEDRLSTVEAVEFRIDQGGWSALQAAGPGGELGGQPAGLVDRPTPSLRARPRQRGQSVRAGQRHLPAGGHAAAGSGNAV